MMAPLDHNGAADPLHQAWDNAETIKPPDILDEFIDPTTLFGIKPPDREWIWQDWLTVGSVTSLYGSAGCGKTLLAQQLQTAVSTGRPFFGYDTMQCPVLAVYCEDDNDELHRRQVCINQQGGITMLDLGGMRYQGRFGQDNVMGVIENGVLTKTGVFDFVLEAAKKFGARLVIIDNIAQVFAGNENVRSDVTQFVNALGRIAQEINGAVLLLGHPAKAADSQFSGSTAWDAAVRSRWILNRPEADKDEQEAGEVADLRVLRKAKANYSGTGDEIPLRWEKGAFRAEGRRVYKDAVDRIEERVREKADEVAFLACLDTLSSQGRSTSHSKHAPNYAPKAMLGKSETNGIPKKRLEQAMERLFNDRAIVVGTCGRGKDRKVINGIVRAPCGEVAGDLQEGPDDLREGCGKVQDDFADEAAKSLKSEREGSCGEVAGRLREGSEGGTAKSLKSEREGCGKGAGESTPLYTTYIEGGTLGAVPPSDEDIAPAGNADPDQPAEPSPALDLVIEEYDP
jgi:RecA-family ATPase